MPRPHVPVWVAAVAVALLAMPAAAQPTPEQVEFFETTIRPLLADSCFQCHSACTADPFGGLRLDTREGLLAGGDSGPVVVPGDAAASALVQRVRGRPLLMPPVGTRRKACQGVDLIQLLVEEGVRHVVLADK